MFHGALLRKWQRYLQLFLWKQENPWLFDEERKVSHENFKILFFKALANRFRLTNTISYVREQQSFLCSIIYQMDFIERQRYLIKNKLDV